MADEANTSNSDTQAKSQSLRLWPALLFILIGLSVSLGIREFGSTNEHNVIRLLIAPLVASIGIVLWWLVGSRVKGLHRVYGLLLFIGLLGILFASQSEHLAAVLIVLIAVPYFTYGVVILLTLVRNRAWKIQSRWAIVYMLLCCCVFSLLRVDSVSGGLIPEMYWRWKPQLEESTSTVLSDESPAKIAEVNLEITSADWPEFRGEKRDGQVRNVSFNQDWSTPPNELWRKAVGGGWSSFTVIGDYFFTQEQRGKKEAVVCYLVETGEEIWLSTIEESFEEIMGNGPRATPTYKDGRLYAQGATGVVQCLDARTGKQIWQRDLRVDAKADVPQWGYSSSPLVVSNRVIHYAGGSDDTSVIAYDKDTGDIAWNTGKGKTGYASAQQVSINNVPQVLLTSNFGVESFVAATGEVLWGHEWRAKSNPRVVQPLLTEDGGILIGTPGGQGTRRIQVAKEGDVWAIEEQWTTRKFRPYFNDMIIFEDYCYGFDGDRLVCIDTATGDMQWKSDRIGGQMILVKDMGMLLVLTEEGKALLVKAQPEAYTVQTEFQAINGKTWNHPVIAGGRLFVRNSEEMACYELGPA